MKAFRVETLAGLTAMLAAVTKLVNNMLKDELVAVVEVKEGERGRTALQNAKMHSMLTDISKQSDINGKKFDIVVWKRLCVAQWLKDKGERPQIVPSLDGQEVVVIYEKTSKMSVKQVAEFVEWLYAYGAENNVKWTKP